VSVDEEMFSTAKDERFPADRGHPEGKERKLTQ
jgi:hypothetical protein